jgi:hypothetical protein
MKYVLLLAWEKPGFAVALAFLLALTVRAVGTTIELLPWAVLVAVGLLGLSRWWNSATRRRAARKLAQDAEIPLKS